VPPFVLLERVEVPERPGPSPSTTPAKGERVHDQLFKGLLDRFLGDFVRIVLPGEAPSLDLERVKFHRDEYFTDVHQGKRWLLDVVAEVRRTNRRSKPVLLHVEIEARARGRSMDQRMWRYAMVLRLRHRKPVASVVLYVRGGPAGAEDVTVDDHLAKRHLARFVYRAFGLSKCQAAEYLERPEPLAPALAALMRRGKLTPAEHKYRCLQRIARLRLDEAARHLLVNCVESYLQLEGEDQREFETLLAQEPSQEVSTMQMTYEEKVEARGMKKGLEQGMEKGLEKGMEKGRVEGMRSMLLGQLERRFGPLAGATRAKVEAIASADELSRLADRVLDARSVEDLGL
jgi:hypothetical protein